VLNKIFGLMLVVFATSLFASGGGNGETDIIPRTVNFLIFAGILYYLIADKIKAFFSGRVENIKGDMEKVQELLKDSKKKKEEAQQKVEEAKKIAEDLVASANKEAKSISEKIDQNVKTEIENLVKQNVEAMELEKRKVVKSVAQEVIEELLKDDAINISNEKIIDIIKKKVA
jgi:F-type H+-transporting ATPase subunit b